MDQVDVGGEGGGRGCEGRVVEVTNYIVVKTADPKSGTPVGPGQVIDYTITVTQQGTAPAEAEFTDDLTDVLDGATYNNDVRASLGTVTRNGDALDWSGTVPVGGTVTVTYSVTVNSPDTGNTDLLNPVTSPGCVTAVSCRTDHKVGWFTYDKIANPTSGSTVAVGKTITYTVSITQHGKAAVDQATVTDDMTSVLDDATYANDATASTGAVSYSSPHLVWKGDLAVGQTVTITYSVTVTGNGNQHLANVVTTTDERGVCDTTVGCHTEHTVTQPAAADNASSTGLASTGNDTRLQVILAGLLVVAGALLTITARRRRRAG